jgi:hypothetical protein
MFDLCPGTFGSRKQDNCYAVRNVKQCPLPAHPSRLSGDGVLGPKTMAITSSEVRDTS